MSNDLQDRKALAQRFCCLSFHLAKAFGICSAMLLGQIHYYCLITKKVRDGHRWTYRTGAEWVNEFQGIYTERTIRASISDLRTQGILLVSNYNQHGYDRTLWYRIDYDRLAAVLEKHFPGQEILAKELPFTVQPLQAHHETISPYPHEIVSQPIPKNTYPETTGEILALPAARKTTSAKPFPRSQPMPKQLSSAQAILAVHKAKASGAPLSTAKPNTSASLQSIWRREVPRHNEAVQFIPEFTLQAKGQLSHIAKALGPKADKVMTAVVQHWVAFTKFVAEANGLKMTPDVPHIGFILKNVGHAANFAQQHATNPLQSANTPAKVLPPIAKAAKPLKNHAPKPAPVQPIATEEDEDGVATLEDVLAWKTKKAKV